MGRGEVQGDTDLIQRQGGAVSVSYGYDNAARQTTQQLERKYCFVQLWVTGWAPSGVSCASLACACLLCIS